MDIRIDEPKVSITSFLALQEGELFQWADAIIAVGHIEGPIYMKVCRNDVGEIRQTGYVCISDPKNEFTGDLHFHYCAGDVIPLKQDSPAVLSHTN